MNESNIKRGVLIKDLSLRKLDEEYNIVYILKDINLFFPSSIINFVYGESGIGKTSLLNCIFPFTRNQVDIKVTGDIYYVYGEEYMNFNSSAFSYITQNVLTKIAAYRYVGNIIFDFVDKRNIDIGNEMIKSFGLTHTLNKKFFSCSGGEKFRIALLRELLDFTKEVLLLDEPFAALDIYNRRLIMDFLIFFAKTFNKTIILTCHDPFLYWRFGGKFVKFNKKDEVQIIEDNAKIRLDDYLITYFGIKKEYCDMILSDKNMDIVDKVEKFFKLDQ